MRVEFGVLGPVTAWSVSPEKTSGTPIALKGPAHRAVLARLIVARGRVVPVGHLVDDLWPVAAPEGAVAAVRTFVAALRRALEPDRPRRAPASLLVTEGPGYALRAEAGSVDAWRFERVADGPLSEEALTAALRWWRGPAYADFPEAPWARADRARLAELRLRAVERLAEARLAAGRAAAAIADLDAHVTEHSWREEAWRLLALALYQADRQGDALAVLRQARGQLVDRLGIDPGPALRRLESDILRQSPIPLGTAGRQPAAAGEVWAEVTADYDRLVASGARARLDSTVGLLRGLAVTGGGGLVAARRHRVAAIAAAEELGDPALTAKVIGSYDVPAIWTRSDDPVQAAGIVAAAERALALLPPEDAAARARLLATIAVESRGVRDERVRDCALEAERLARGLDDPGLLAFALNGVFMQSCHRTGLAPERDAIGAELITLAAAHGLVTAEVLGHLIRLQARSALGDFPSADTHAGAADRLAARHELPLVAVFTTWYRALRRAAGGAPLPVAEAAYRRAAERLDGAGMPGLEEGLLPLAVLCLRVWRGEPAPTDDYGPYEPWARPLVLIANGRTTEALEALRAAPDPPPGLLAEALWCLLGSAARTLGDRPALERVRAALAPAAGEIAGAASGLITAGPVADYTSVPV
ncbi:AfsR/SARP family transcriptional regulator [Paractinoplanes atraurantiacus]|uniref:DNA-binding transcriptional activator of the SARP family n=1 Tax=Paractinoplanes atraurantiacus TaxID=1036182 RepID=A0A285IDH5_9ACTN|nr:BTAD domain-containing putative transcriptional regulator [Actinoplanes atraurantiacus]SNY46038.1 DNA-binding transcriptional activator of the SARP family [Actinoplanes atraurantiacus]